MGWDYTRSYSRADVIREHLSPHGYPSSDGKFWRERKAIGSATRGNHLWVIYEVTDRLNETGQALQYRHALVVHLLGSSKGCGWGSKSMDVSMHPYYYTCSKALYRKWLEIQPLPENDMEKDWRAAQEQAHSHDEWLKRMRPGDLFGSRVDKTVYERGREALYNSKRNIWKTRIAGYVVHDNGDVPKNFGAWAICKHHAVPVPVYKED